MPAAARKHNVNAELIEFELRKIECAHLLPLALVPRPVPIECLLPALCFAAA